LFSTASTAFAEVSIETNVSRSVVPVGEELTLDLIVNNAQGPIGTPKISSIEGFTSYSQGHSQEISFTNGRTSSCSVFSYVLIANSPGQKTLGPFELLIDGKPYRAAPVQVMVTAASSSPSYTAAVSQGPANAPPPRAMPSATVQTRDIFVKAWLDKDEVFVNEPAMLTYTLYTRLSATYKGFEKEPVTTGFWVEDFPPEKTIRRTEQYLNGSRYVVADVRKLALFPTQAGIFTLEPGVLSAAVEVQSDDSFNSFYSYNIFGRGSRFPSSFLSQIVSQSLPTESLKVTVKALPAAGKPANFTGAVGQYEMSSSVDKKQVEAGNPVTVRVKIKGRGNINTVQIPPLAPIDGLKIYDAASSSQISKDRLIVEGEKVSETVVVPKKDGTFTIPPFHFSYFDPQTMAYEEIQTQAHTFKATPAPEAEEPLPPLPTSESVSQNDVSVMAKDIRFVKTTDAAGPLEGNDWVDRPLYWLLNGLLFLAVAASALVSRWRRRGSEAKGWRVYRAGLSARKRLRQAGRLLRQKNQDAFYAEISKAFMGYFADRLDITPQAVSKDEVIRALAEKISPETLNGIESLFEALSLGRFGRADHGEDEMKRVYQTASRLIDALEKARLK